MDSTSSKCSRSRNGSITSDTSDEDKDDHSHLESPRSCRSSYPHIQIDRRAMDQKAYHTRLQFEGAPQKPWRRLLIKVLRRVRSFNCQKMFMGLFPILSWLPAYDWKHDLIPDASAGFTVAVMHIPQGMAYALLALIPPIAGIYTAFFPIMIYILMGTAKHVSFGTFAVISILVSKSVHHYSYSEDVNVPHYEPIQVATAVTFMSGIIQILFGLFRFGTLCSLLSYSLIGGFTTGAAVHVFSSQIKYLLGVTVKRYEGPLALVYFYKALFSKIASTNLITLGISLTVLVCLELYSRLCEARITKLLKGVTFPIHLVLVILGTMFSYFFHLHEVFGVQIVGEVLTGLPYPTPPPPELFQNLIVDAFIVAVIGYVISYSLGVLFAEKHGYKVSADQEFLAMGASNVFGSFFMSLPISGSLSRTSVQDRSGCRTLMTSVVSIFCLLWVLLFAGPLLEPLPNAVLSALIVNALKGTFMQVLDCPKLFQKSLSDFGVWVLTFFATVILGVDLGLLVGVAANLALVVKWTLQPKLVVMAETDFVDLNVDPAFFHDVKTNNQCILARVRGSINFLNAVSIRDAVEEALENQKDDDDTELKDKASFFILDLSGVSQMDCAGCKCLKDVNKRLRTHHMKLIVTGAYGELWRKFELNGVFEDVHRHRFFPTIYDALAIVKEKAK